MGGVLHMRREREIGEGLDLRESVCGMIAVAITEDPGLVRCKLCRKRMGPSVVAVERDPKPDSATIDPSPLELPFEPGPPVPSSLLGGAHTLSVSERALLARIDRGEDVDVRPRWSSLEKAIAMTSAIQMARSPIRSSWKVEQESRSEGAVRTEYGRDEFIEIERAFAMAFDDLPEPIRIGSAGPLLMRGQLSAILEQVLRDYATAEDVARKANGLDAATFCTAQDVGALVRHGKARMRSMLERKGLIEARRVKGWTRVRGEEAIMAAPMGFDLDGWKEILPLLGMTETTARERMVRQDDPLPITPWSGRVIGVRADIAAWVGREAVREREARRKVG